jgi:histidinol-phosphatase (PHP family)
MAFARGIPVCFGSDAHKPHEVGHAFAQAAALARETGYRQAAVFRNRNRTLVDLPVSA